MPMSLLFLVAVLGLTLFLQHWLHKHIQGFTFALTSSPGCALRVLFLLLLPGILLHEGSHWLVANVLNVKTGQVSIGVARTRGKMMSLGSVYVERTDPIRESLIGAAPFLFGLGAILLIAGVGVGVWPSADLTVYAVVDRVGASLSLWTTWVSLYLIFAVSTAMIPSESDREPWGMVLLVAGAIVVGAIFFGWFPSVTPEMIDAGKQALSALNLAFGVSALVNGVVAFVLWIAELTLGSFTRRRVRY